jgi:hypothetical protein
VIVPDLPSDAVTKNQASLLMAAGCSEKFCLAAGKYRVTSDPGDPSEGWRGHQYPFVIVSTDAGKTWIPKIVAKDLPSDAVTKKQMSELVPPSICQGSVCVVSGVYTSAKDTGDGNNFYPLIGVSADTANTWKVIAPQLPSDAVTKNQRACLLPGRCTGNVCFTAGGYRAASGAGNGVNSYPLVGVSTDAGNNWKVTSPELPSDAVKTNQLAALIPGLNPLSQLPGGLWQLENAPGAVFRTATQKCFLPWAKLFLAMP